jgi:DinB family protein
MTHTSVSVEAPPRATSQQAQALADRLEAGARALAAFAATLTDDEWQMPVPHDGRTVGVVVHHVASVYPVEIELAQVLAGGTPMTGVVMDDIHAMNAKHATEYATVTNASALELLRTNSAAAAAAIRALSDEQLTNAATVSLYSDAPLTCQFFLEDHAVRHSYHHLARLKRTVGR